MSPKRSTLARAALLITPVVAFFLYAALNWFRIEESHRWVGMEPEALKEPYLAYTRLLSRMDTGARVTELPSSLDSPPERGVLIVASRRLVYMSERRIEKIEAWVERGGTLVVEAEPAAIDDPLLEAFGMERETPEAPRPGAMVPTPSRRKSSQITFDWQGTGNPLRIDPGFGAARLKESRPHLDLSVGSVEGDLLAVSFPSGAGRVVVLGSFSFLRNTQIQKLDHAELGWQLASAGTAQGGAVLFLRPPRAALGEWLLKEAWPVLIAAGILLLVWLLRVVPRFGPLAPDPEPVRRRLSEHIAASGRFLWSRGERAYLLDAARERVWRAASRRFARIASMDRAAAIDRIAESASMSRLKAHRGLAAKAADEAAFIAASGALQDLESALGRRTNRRT